MGVVTRYPACMPLPYKRGPDVAEFNTATKLIPWHTFDFGCFRLTSGLRLDKLADEHLRRAIDGGVSPDMLMAYAYLQGVHEGSGQAKCLIERAHQLEDAEHCGPLALAVDIEDPLNGPPWPREKYGRILVDFVETLAEHAPMRPPALYVSPAFWAQLVPFLGADAVALIAALPLWLADWSPPANIPKHFTRWHIWQHEVTPISQSNPSILLDRNYFDGDAEDWRRIFHPDPHSELGPVVTAVQQASGHGPGGVQDFATRDEGPVIP